jgi:hypothetical protein
MPPDELSPDALDALASQTEELDPAQLDAMEAQVPAPNPVDFQPEPMSRGVPKAPDLVQTLPPEQSMSSNAPDPYAMMEAMQGEGSVQQALNPLEGADRLLKAGQQYAGRPVANAIIDLSQKGPLRAPVEAVLGDQAANLLQRRVLGLLGGDLVEGEGGMSEAQRLQATNQLEARLGTTGGAYAEGLAEQVGFAPLLALTPGAAATGAAAGERLAVAGLDANVFPTLTSVLGKLGRAGGAAVATGAEGAALGGLQAGLTPGQTVEEGVTSGALFGAALGLGGAALGQVVARLRPAEQPQLGREVAALPLDSPALQPIPVKSLKELKPTSYTVGVWPEGDVFARIFRLKEDGKVGFADVPLNTEADAAALAKLVKEHGLTANIPAEVWASDPVRAKSRQWEWNVWGQDGALPESSGRPRQQPVSPEQLARADEPTRVARAKTPLPRITAQPLDAPPPDLVPTQDVEVLADGTMQPASTPPPEPSGPSYEELVAQRQAQNLLRKSAGLKPLPMPVRRAVYNEAPFALPEGMKGRELTRTGITLKGVAVPDYAKLAEEAAKVEYIPNSQPVPEQPHPIGTQVYVKAGNDRGFQVGEVVGYTGHGSVKVSTSEGKTAVAYTRAGPRASRQTVDVPLSDVWAVEPTASPKTLTAAPVPPPPPVLPGQLAPVAIERARLAQNIARRLGGAANKVLNGVMGKGLRGPQDLAAFIQSTMGSRALQETAVEAMGVMRKAFKSQGVLMQAFDRDVEQVFLGKMDFPTLTRRYPQVANEIDRILRPIKQEIDANEQRIADLGGIPESLIELRDSGEMDRYLARLYLKHTLGDAKWSKYALRSDALMRPAADELVKQLTRNGHYATPAMVQTELEHIVGAPNALEAMANNELFKAAYGDRLKKLGDIPQVFRDLMGEIHSGQYRAAVSLGSQRAIIANLELMQELATNRNWSNVGQISGWQRLPLNQRYYGKASGMYVRPEIYDALVNLPKAQEQMPGIIRKLYGFQRSNLVGLNPGVVLRNTVEDIWHSVLAGGLDPFRPGESGQAMLRAIDAMLDHSRNPSGNGPGQLVLEAKKFNAVNAGWGATETGAVHEQFLQFAKDILKQSGGQDMWSVLDALQTAMSKYRRFVGKTAQLQDTIGQTFRMANYLSLMEKFQAQPGRYGLREALGMAKGLGLSRQEAARLASLRINQSFQNPTNIGAAVNALRNPLFGPFFPSVADEIRVWGHAAVRLKSEPDLIWRMGALATFLGGIWGANGLAKQLNGITPQDEARAQALIPDSQKGFHPALVSAPWRDSRTGLSQQYDLSPFSTMASLLQGNPDSPMWNRVLSNLVSLPVAGGMGEAIPDALLTRAGIVRPFGPNGQPKLLEGEAGLVQALNTLNQAGGLLPSGVTRVVNAVRQLNPQGIPKPQPVTPGQAAQYAAGIPVVTPRTSPTAPNPMTAATMEKVGQLREAAGEYKRAVRGDKMELFPDITQRVQDVAKKFNPPK